MFNYRKYGITSASCGGILLILSIVSFALDYRTDCVCDGWETCCEINTKECGEEYCLCSDVLLSGESDESYCASKTVVPSLSLAFWAGYIAVLAGVLCVKLGIVLCIAGACLERDKIRRENVQIALGQPTVKVPGKGEKEEDSLVL